MTPVNQPATAAQPVSVSEVPAAAPEGKLGERNVQVLNSPEAIRALAQFCKESSQLLHEGNFLRRTLPIGMVANALISSGIFSLCMGVAGVACLWTMATDYRQTAVQAAAYDEAAQTLSDPTFVEFANTHQIPLRTGTILHATAVYSDSQIQHIRNIAQKTKVA